MKGKKMILIITPNQTISQTFINPLFFDLSLQKNLMLQILKFPNSESKKLLQSFLNPSLNPRRTTTDSFPKYQHLLPGNLPKISRTVGRDKWKHGRMQSNKARRKFISIARPIAKDTPTPSVLPLRPRFPPLVYYYLPGSLVFRFRSRGERTWINDVASRSRSNLNPIKNNRGHR